MRRTPQLGQKPRRLQLNATMFDFLNKSWVMCSNNGIECGLFRLVPVVGGNASGIGLKKYTISHTMENRAK